MEAKVKHRINLPALSVLVLLIGFLFRSLAVKGQPPENGKDDRPNILLVMADDWVWPYAGAYGDSFAATPYFDRIAREGVLFTHAFCAAPSCTPSRLSILTGQYPHRLNEGADHMVKFPKSYDVYPEMLERAGYYVGKYKKGASFGSMQGTDWEHDPAGEDYKSFAVFLDQNLQGKPFCFWYGSSQPHRPYHMAAAINKDLFIQRINRIKVPDYLPDCQEVRLDMLDYAFAIESFDRDLHTAIYMLEVRNLLDNTIIIVTSDNGMPFPRGKGNCYDAGMRMPLAIMWPNHIAGGRICDEMIHLSDLAPTILEAAGLSPTADMTGLSFYHLLMDSLSSREEGSTRDGRTEMDSSHRTRDAVFLERERHNVGRGGDANATGMLSYPIRAVRTKDFLYLVNLRPDLWPACDPPDFKDVDPSPTKEQILKYRNAPDSLAYYFELSFGKRPREELYDVHSDPYQIHNLATDPEYRRIKKKLWERLRRWMVETKDPRANGEDNRWDTYEWNPNRKAVTPIH